MPRSLTDAPLPPIASAIAGIIQATADDNLAGYATLDMSRTLIENWQKHEIDTPTSNIPQTACDDLAKIIGNLQAIRTRIGTLRCLDIKITSDDVERIITALTNMADCDEDNGHKDDAAKSKRIVAMLRTAIKSN